MVTMFTVFEDYPLKGELESFILDDNFGAKISFGPDDPCPVILCDPSVDVEEDISSLNEHLGVELKHHPDPHFLGAEKGDDVVTISNSTLLLVCNLVAISSFMKMKLSLDDTFISERVVNYTEDTILLPRSKVETWQIIHKTNSMDNLPVLDVTRLKILSLASKENQDESTTAEGKLSAVGSWLKAMHPYSRNMRMVAGLMQDLTLGACHEDRPKYLPHYLGGLNVQIPGRKSNLFNFLSSWRSGRQKKFYAAVFHEVSAQVELWKRGLPRPCPFFSDKILAQSKSEKIVGARLATITPDERIEKAKLGRSSEDDPFQASVYRRLESQELVSSEETVHTMIGADLIRKAINSGFDSGVEFTTLGNLLHASKVKRVISAQEASPLVETYWEETPYAKQLSTMYGVVLPPAKLYVEVCEQVAKYLSDSHIDLELIMRETTWYDTKVVKEILQPVNWKISGIGFSILHNGQESETRSDMPERKLLEWCVTALEAIKLKQNVDPTFVNDDGDIWRQCFEFQTENRRISWRENPKESVIIVTNDERLCRNISEQLGITIIRMPSEINVLLNSIGVSLELVLPTHPELTRVGKIIYDTGSLLSAQVLHDWATDLLKEYDLQSPKDKHPLDFTRQSTYIDVKKKFMLKYSSWPEPFHVYRRKRYDMDRMRVRDRDQPRYTWMMKETE
jgi:hypothetical protein